MSPEEAHLCAALQAAADHSGRARILIARDAGISQKHLSKVLLGQSAVSLTTAARIADACGHRLIIQAVRDPDAGASP